MRRIRALLGDEPGALQAATLQELLRAPAPAQPLEQPQASADLGAFQQMLEDDPGMLDALLTSGEAPGERQILAQEAAIAKHLSALPSAQGRQVGQVYSAPSIFEALSSSGLQMRGQQLQRENLAAQRDVLGQETEGLRRLVKSRAAPDALDLGASLAGPRAVPLQQALDQRKARALEKTLAAKWANLQATQQFRAGEGAANRDLTREVTGQKLAFQAGEGEANRDLTRDVTGQKIASTEMIAKMNDATKRFIAQKEMENKQAIASVSRALKLGDAEAKFVEDYGKALTEPSTRSANGIAKILFEKSERALNLLSKDKPDPFDVTSQQQADLALALSQVLSGSTGAGNLSEKARTKLEIPADILSKPAALWEFLARRPVGRRQQEQVKLLLGMIKNEHNSIGQQILVHQLDARARFMPGIKQHPEAADLLENNLGLGHLKNAKRPDMSGVGALLKKGGELEVVERVADGNGFIERLSDGTYRRAP